MAITKVDKMYGYKLGQIVIAKVDLWTENSEYLPIGTKLRIVSFAEKVYKTKYPDNLRNDSKPYFINAVLATQTKDYDNRVRPDFCTIRKLLKGE